MRDTEVNYFNNQMFNPIYYKTCQPAQIFNNNDVKIAKAVHAVHDLCDAVKRHGRSTSAKSFLGLSGSVGKRLKLEIKHFNLERWAEAASRICARWQAIRSLFLRMSRHAI